MNNAETRTEKSKGSAFAEPSGTLTASAGHTPDLAMPKGVLPYETPHVSDEHKMLIIVPNTRPDKPRVTLFGQLNDGSYTAKVMDEDEVPYTYCWDNAIDQAMVYIEPDDDQLERMITALNEGRLEFSRLQDFGTANGGTSTIAV